MAGVDIPVARAILAYNTRRYPDGKLLIGSVESQGSLQDLGVFFLYFQARLHTSQCEPELANSEFRIHPETQEPIIC